MPTDKEIAAVAAELDKANLNLSDTMRAILSRRLLLAAARAQPAAGEAPIERQLVGETIVGAARSTPPGLLMLDTASGRTFQIAGDSLLEIVELEGAR